MTPVPTHMPRTGWQTIKGKRYYYTKDGKMVTGWKTISGKKYYFDKTGALIKK